MHCAQRTLPGTIDAIARDAPTRTWGRFPESQEAFEQGKLVTVNFATLANSINRVAWVLDALLPERSDLDTIAYIGPSDIRYYILACAACKCRLKVGSWVVSIPDAMADFHCRHYSRLPGTTSLRTCRYLKVLVVGLSCNREKNHLMVSFKV